MLASRTRCQVVDKVIFWVLGGALFFSIAMLGTILTTFMYTWTTTRVAIIEGTATAVCLLLLWAVSVLRPRLTR